MLYSKYCFPAYCIKIRQGASVKLIFQHSKKIKTGLFGSTFQELFKFKNGNLFGTEKVTEIRGSAASLTEAIKNTIRRRAESAPPPMWNRVKVVMHSYKSIRTSPITRNARTIAKEIPPRTSEKIS